MQLPLSHLLGRLKIALFRRLPVVLMREAADIDDQLITIWLSIQLVVTKSTYVPIVGHLYVCIIVWREV